MHFGPECNTPAWQAGSETPQWAVDATRLKMHITVFNLPGKYPGMGFLGTEQRQGCRIMISVNLYIPAAVLIIFGVC